ncbi:terminase large subunit domain-containing protein [Aeromonas veronii]
MLHAELLQRPKVAVIVPKIKKKGIPKTWKKFLSAYEVRRITLQNTNPTGLDFKDTEDRFNGERMFRGPNHSLDYTEEMIEEFNRCRNSITYFASNYCAIVSGDGLIKIPLRDYQIDYLELLANENKTIAVWSRQSSKTTCVSIFLAWLLCFNPYFSCGVLSHTMQGAHTIMGRVYEVLGNLPDWLAPNIIEKSKGRIATGAGSTLEAFASSTGSIRGQSLHCVYVDECAHLDRDLGVIFPEQIAPAASFRNSRIVLTTTPNGKDYTFTLWQGAKTLLSNGNGFKRFAVSYKDVPENNYTRPVDGSTPVYDGGVSFKAEKLASSTAGQFAVEYENSFESLSNTLLSLEALRRLTASNVEIDPDYPEIKIFAEHVPNARYVVGVDLGTQIGKDHSVAVVYAIDSKEVVCTYRDNKSVLDDVAMTIGNIAYLFNNAPLIVETGDKWNISAHVLNVLQEEFEEARYYRKRLNANSRAIIGLVQSKHTKALGYSLLREEFEGHHQIKVNDEQLIDELKTFVEIKKRFSLSTAPVYGAAENKHDDLVMGLMLCLVALNDDDFKEELAHSDWSEMEDDSQIDYFYSDYGCLCSGVS